METLITDTRTNLKGTIAPYSKEEVQAALVRLMKSEDFINGIKYFFPDWAKEQICTNLKKCHSCTDFEIIFVEPIIKNIIEKSISTYEVFGLDKLKKGDSFLCISNHRDILLDAGLLQYSLYHQGLPFTEISLGDNLMVNKLIETVAKMNNMFTVYRSGTKMELLRNAQKLSAYIRYAIVEKNASAWIAQGNGRTKNGNDVTSPGLINMLLMSGGSDYKKSLEELNIIISSISYEYEPCAFEKAREMDIIAKTGQYEKTKYEDLNNILKGIKAPKGNVSLVLESLDINAIDFSGKRKEVLMSITQILNKTVYKNYRLWKTNFIAYDCLYKTKQYQSRYTPKDKNTFKKYLLSRNEGEEIIKRVLEIYARPVKNLLG